MTEITPLMPRQPVPDFSVPLVDGGTWTLSHHQPENFTMIVVYRGRHCPICSRYLGGLNKKLGEFGKRGVSVIAISSDPQDRAESAKADWELDALPIGYDLSLSDARKLGLYISTSRGMTSIGIEEPALFVEPGLFLVRPDGTLYFGSVQTMPFARPPFAEMLGAIDFALEKDYPARGEVVSLPQAS